MADTRFVPQIKVPFINPYMDYLTINNGTVCKLLEITDPFAHAKISVINSNQNKEVYTLNSSPNNPIELSTAKNGNKVVKRIRFHVILKEGQGTFLAELSFDNKEKKIYTFRSQEDFNYLLKTMQLKGIYEKTSEDKSEKYDWKNHKLEEHYDEIIENNYRKYFAVIAETLTNILSQVQTHEIHLISPGCGTANDLEFLRQQLADKYNLHFKGFDINENNIEKAKTKIPQGYFEKSTLADMEKFIQKINNDITQPACKVFIFSGVLAQGIAEDKKSAIRYLQYAARSADVIVLASQTYSFIDSCTAKAAGLKTEKIVSVLTKCNDPISNLKEISRGVYFYKKPTPEERVAFLIQRSSKRKRKDSQNTTIDLSLSANPLQDLKWLNEYNPTELTAASQLDLGWCYVKDNEIAELAETIKKLSFKTIIVGPNDLDWARSLQKLTNLKFVMRTDSPNNNTPHHGSIPSLRRLGLLDELTCKALKQEEGVGTQNNMGKKL